MPFNLPSAIERVENHPFDFELYVKREDQIHEEISGNKYRKLKYNILHVIEKGYKGVISFGGPYSNHIHALAAICNLYGLKSIGIIRGEEVENKTLSFARKKGMDLYFINREEYRRKEESVCFSELKNQYPDYYFIPEGGSNELALKGVKEMVDEIHHRKNDFDYLVVAAGTGYTAAGILSALKEKKIKSKLLVFSALKGDFLKKVIAVLAEAKESEFYFTDESCLGGYAKVNDEYMNWLKELEEQTGILIDHVYNGKVLLGLKWMNEKKLLKQGDKVLWIHTGGIQGRF